MDSSKFPFGRADRRTKALDADIENLRLSSGMRSHASQLKLPELCGMHSAPPPHDLSPTPNSRRPTKTRQALVELTPNGSVPRPGTSARTLFQRNPGAQRSKRPRGQRAVSTGCLPGVPEDLEMAFGPNVPGYRSPSNSFIRRRDDGRGNRMGMDGDRPSVGRRDSQFARVSSDPFSSAPTWSRDGGHTDLSERDDPFQSHQPQQHEQHYLYTADPFNPALSNIFNTTATPSMRSNPPPARPQPPSSLPRATQPPPTFTSTSNQQPSPTTEPPVYRLTFSSRSLAGNPPFTLFQTYFPLAIANARARALATECCRSHLGEVLRLDSAGGGEGEAEGQVWVVVRQRQVQVQDGGAGGYFDSRHGNGAVNGGDERGMQGIFGYGYAGFGEEGRRGVEESVVVRVGVCLVVREAEEAEGDEMEM
ncbi:hypothetical protein M011DRAFT_476160 [Sporormia fimetaria CBS 119925]|uniref:Uncharacterized protein n=1 Tax=Sporormia fimetaria CBS 119925 TaxID=1340428 RepID=A0A6A6VGQ6_9PLEO|nr:hypothetical protein M011DRAFT_476160 [Sporormia fimetaria CBS 119925]